VAHQLPLSHPGKDLSDGWVVNFAIGCTHGCLFCYVDRIWSLHTANKRSPYYGMKLGEWGRYLYVPEDLEEQIRRTPWRKWSGKRLLMSSTHDPYLPELYFPRRWPRRILEAALPHGVRFTILTRSALPMQDFDLYAKYREQILLMSSIPTLDDAFARITEPRAPPPDRTPSHAQKSQGAGHRDRRSRCADNNEKRLEAGLREAVQSPGGASSSSAFL
jgi:DNA repair photolyase